MRKTGRKDMDGFILIMFAIVGFIVYRKWKKAEDIRQQKEKEKEEQKAYYRELAEKSSKFHEKYDKKIDEMMEKQPWPVTWGGNSLENITVSVFPNDKQMLIIGRIAVDSEENVLYWESTEKGANLKLSNDEEEIRKYFRCRLKGDENVKDKAEAYVNLAKDYEKKAREMLQKEEIEIVLDLCRKTLECIFKATSIDNDIHIADRDMTNEIMIDMLCDQGAITQNEKKRYHRIRILCNKGVHVNLNEKIDIFDAKKGYFETQKVLREYLSQILLRRGEEEIRKSI